MNLMFPIPFGSTIAFRVLFETDIESQLALIPNVLGFYMVKHLYEFLPIVSSDKIALYKSNDIKEAN
jgi:hypothetical protein